MEMNEEYRSSIWDPGSEIQHSEEVVSGVHGNKFGIREVEPDTGNGIWDAFHGLRNLGKGI